MTRAETAWDRLLCTLAAAFTQPSFTLFQELAQAWVLCPGRRTVTAMIRMLGPKPRRAHDAYHRFVREGAWSMTSLWSVITKYMVSKLAAQGVVQIDLDDTLFHKTGRKVAGAGIFRDAVRSTGKRVVYALGLNLVVLSLRVTPPWGGEPLGLPINLRLYRKKGRSHIDLAEDMIREVAGWLPSRKLCLCADGAYATLAGRGLPQTEVVSRMRRDAAIYEMPPKSHEKKRGRPRKKGKRLPTPEKMAKRTQKGWKRTKLNIRGKTKVRLILSRPVLWYRVRPDQQVLLVIVRDPEGNEPDDFFFTTNLKASKKSVVECYAGRWSIEDTFRNVKQFLGGQDPQTWKGEGPERATSLSMLLYSLVWTWYISTKGTAKTWLSLPWYKSKCTPSFLDALATLRRVLWGRSIFCNSGRKPISKKIIGTLIDALAWAA